MTKKWLILIFGLALLLNGCSQNLNKSSENTANTFYAGEGEEWFATYTVSKVKTSYFDSLYIQYVTDRSTVNMDQMEKKGPIEYVLDAKFLKNASSFPQELKGIGNFHVASEMNAELLQSELPKEVTLEVKWHGKSETIILKKS